MAELQEDVEQTPQPLREEDVTQKLPPEAATGGMSPLEQGPPPEPQNVDLGEFQKLLDIALSQEFLRGNPYAREIQRLATSINMILRREDIDETERQRILEELVPQLLDLMEKSREKMAPKQSY